MFYDVYCRLCEKKGKSLTTAAREIGLAATAPQQWREGSIPRIGTLQKIAAYFDVPIGMLMEREPEPQLPTNAISVVTAEELAVVAQYRQLTPENREKAREYMEFLQMKQPKEKTQVS